MMIRKFLLGLVLLLLLLPIAALAQPSNPQIILVASAPSGACNSGLPDQQTITPGALYSCQNGTWGSVGGGGGITYPAGTGFAIVTGGAAWGTTLTDPLSVGHGGTGTATVPTTNQIPIGTSGAYNPVTVSGDAIISSAGVVTVQRVNGVAIPTSAFILGSNALNNFIATTQAADTVDMNASGSTAAPTAVAMPACTTGADLYNTTTHSWSCVSTSGGNWVNIGSAVTFTPTGGTGSFASGVFTTTNASNTVITITNIPGTYLNLRVIEMGPSTSGVVGLNTTFNGDTTTTHYATLGTLTNNTTVSANGGTGLAFTQIALIGPLSGSAIIDIPGYTQGIAKSIVASSSAITSVSAQTSNYKFDAGAIFTPTSAITSIALTISAAAYASGDVFMIYGSN